MQAMHQDRDPGSRPLWITIGILAFLVVALTATLIQRELSRPPPTAGGVAARPEARPSASAPPESQATPPADTLPIAVSGQTGEHCEADDMLYSMTVAALGALDAKNAFEQPVYLADFERVVRKYYLDLSGVPDSDRARLSTLLVVGQHLKVRYVVCGSFRYLTFLKRQSPG